MNNITKIILLFFVFIPLAFGLGSFTVKRIDEIKNNTGVDIVLTPTNDVKITNFSGDFVLQSGILKEIEESTITRTELSYLTGLTSSAQNQIDSKTPLIRLLNTTAPIQGGGDLSTDRTFSIDQSNATTDGFLSFVDWNIFNDKANDIDVVKLIGDQSISGVKNFTGQLIATSIVNGSHPAPSMTQLQIDAIVGEVAGDLVFNLDNSVLNIFDGSEWVEVSGGGGGAGIPDQTGNGGNHLYTNGTNTFWIKVDDVTTNSKTNLLECGTFDFCSTSEGITTTSANISTTGTGLRTADLTAWNTNVLKIEGLNFGGGGYTISHSWNKLGDFSHRDMKAYCEIRTLRPDVKFEIYRNGVLNTSKTVSASGKFNYYSIDFTGGSVSQEMRITGNTSSEEIIRVDNCFMGFKKPTPAAAGNIAWSVKANSSDEIAGSSGQTGLNTQVSSLTVTITPTNTNPIKISGNGHIYADRDQGNGAKYVNLTCLIRVKRNGLEIGNIAYINIRSTADTQGESRGGDNVSHTYDAIDIVVGVPYVYTFEIVASNGACVWEAQVNGANNRTMVIAEQI
jgi:hypothetical protein